MNLVVYFGHEFQQQQLPPPPGQMRRWEERTNPTVLGA